MRPPEPNQNMLYLPYYHWSVSNSEKLHRKGQQTKKCNNDNNNNNLT